MNEVNAFTSHGYKFRAIAYDKSHQWNMLFLPGGPGLGSEIYLPWIRTQTIEDVNLWLLDFPGDGSNHQPQVAYEDWKNNVVPALSALPNVMLVAHSFGGMFALTIPLEKVIAGLILIGATPDNTWPSRLSNQIKRYNLPDLSEAKYAYLKDKNNETFKQFTVASWPYFMRPDSKKAALKLLSHLPYNHAPYDWAEIHFHPLYQAQWVPDTLPTLIMAGECDVLASIEMFKKDNRFSKANIRYAQVAGAGHFPWVEKPEVVFEWLVRFKEEVARAQNKGS